MNVGYCIKHPVNINSLYNYMPYPKIAVLSDYNGTVQEKMMRIRIYKNTLDSWRLEEVSFSIMANL